MKTDQELIDELRGTVCQCGAKKLPRQTFCRACYYRLSKTQRADLYKRFGEGYAQAYERAMVSLSNNCED